MMKKVSKTPTNPQENTRQSKSPASGRVRAPGLTVTGEVGTTSAITKTRNPAIGSPETEEIEVTPAMIEAASAALEDYYHGDGYYDLRPPALGALFHAMARADLNDA